MRRSGLGLLLVLVLVATASGVLAQGITHATLRGRVTNEGQGLPGVLVSIRSNARPAFPGSP